MQLPSVLGTPDGPRAEGSSPELLAELLPIYERESQALVGANDWANPGISPDEVRSQLADIGLSAPDELVVLFAWHNGVPVGGRSPFPRLSFTPLDHLCADYVWRGESYLEYPEEERESISWGAGPGWFPLISDMYRPVIDCSGELEGPPRVRYTDMAFDEHEYPRTSGQIVSLCTLFTWWIEGIRSGAHTWNKNLLVWETDDDLLPELQRRFRVV